ncbi:MAG TPA: immunoglobulin domain-containing protein, partial [Verrucomicrobiae bacterium]
MAGCSGGQGFGEPWRDDAGMGQFNYVPAGLSLGALITGSGAAQVGNLANVAPYLKAEVSRRFGWGTPLAGTIYGSYLFSLPYFGSGNDSLALLFGGTNITLTGLGGSPDNLAQMDVAGLYYNGGSKGNVRLVGAAGSVAGSLLTTNVTYLALWQADGLVTNGAGSEQLRLWIMTAAQFSFFKTNGLTGSRLNAAAVGINSNNVLERATLSGNYGATLLDGSFLALYATLKSSNSPVGITFDEIRIGTGSLDEVTPVTAVASSPQVILNPVSTNTYLGATATFTVGALGYPSLTYRWLAGAPGSGSYTNLPETQNVAGTASAKLSLANISAGMIADYVVVVSNALGWVTSTPPATLGVFSMPAPQLLSAPANQSVPGGTPSVKLNVSATGPSLAYQWSATAGSTGAFTPLADGAFLTGATSPTLTLLNPGVNRSGDYRVVITNLAGAVTCAPAHLNVLFTSNPVPEWALGPFYRPEGINPVIAPNPNANF